MKKLLLLLLVIQVNGEFPLKAVAHYFLNNDISSVVIISCLDIGHSWNGFSGPLFGQIILLMWTGRTNQSKEKFGVLRTMSDYGFLVSFSFSSIPEYPMHRGGAVLDLNCADSVPILKEISQMKLFALHTEWLILDYEGLEESVKDILQDSYILPGSCVTVGSIVNSSIEFYDVFRISRDFPLKFKLLEVQSIQTPNELPKRSSRNDFGNEIIRSATVITRPEYPKGLEDIEHPEIDPWPKIHYPVVLNLAKQLNFNLSLTVVDDHGWKTNGTFSGLMGMLQKEEIEFGCTGLIMREERRELVDFTVHTFDLKTGIIFRQPALSSVSNIYLLPFSRAVWMACGGLFLLVMFLLFAESILSQYTKIPSFGKTSTVFDVLTLVIGFVCQQGTNLVPVTLFGRIVVFIFSLSALFFYTSYSAQIVALLQSTSPTIRSLADLTASPLSLKVQIDEYTIVYFKESTDRNVLDLYRKKVEPFGESVFCWPPEGIVSVRTGKSAYSGDLYLAYKFISATFLEIEKCGLGTLKLFFIPSLSLPTIKKSGYREHITQKVAWQREVGILDRISKLWQAQRPTCSDKGSGFLRVGLEDFQPALMVLVYGMPISIGVFLMEIIFSKWRTANH